MHGKHILFPGSHSFSLLFILAGFVFCGNVGMVFTYTMHTWNTEVVSANMTTSLSLSTLFIETRCCAEPGPNTPARLADHQALEILLSLPHISGITGTFFHTGFLRGCWMFEERSLYPHAKHCHCLSPRLYLLFWPNPVKTLAMDLFLWLWY